MGTAMAKKETPILYHYWRSSSSWRVRWALRHKGVAHQLVAVDLLKGEQQSEDYRKLNPLGLVPTLVLGEQRLAESSAILEYLEEVYPHKPLLPRDPAARARVRQLAQIIVADTQPLQNLSVLRHVSSEAEEQREWARHFIVRGFDAYEALLEEAEAAGASPPGPYSCGEQLTIADLCLIPQCYNARRNGLEIGRWARIAAVEAACLATEACEQSSPNHLRP